MDHERPGSRLPDVEATPPDLNSKSGYEEGLPPQPLAKPQERLRFPTSKNSRNLVFSKEGLDNFRRRCLPFSEKVSKGPREEPLPLIFNTKTTCVPNSCQKKASEKSTSFSMLSEAQLAQKASAEETSLYNWDSSSDLEDCLPIEFLPKSLEMQDFDRLLEDTWAYRQESKSRTTKPAELLKDHPPKGCLRLPKLTPPPHPDNCQKETRADLGDLCTPLLCRSNDSKDAHSYFRRWETIDCTDIDQEFIMQTYESCNWKPNSGQSYQKNAAPVNPKVKPQSEVARKTDANKIIFARIRLLGGKKMQQFNISNSRERHGKEVCGVLSSTQVVGKKSKR